MAIKTKETKPQETVAFRYVKPTYRNDVLQPAGTVIPDMWIVEARGLEATKKGVIIPAPKAPAISTEPAKIKTEADDLVGKKKEGKKYE